MGMTLTEFVDKYKGKLVDFDGAYGAQCVDLVRQYMKEVWGFIKQPEPVISATDFYFKHENRPIQRELCKCVAYSGGEYPPLGSLLVFKPSGQNKDGHIAICLDADREGMKVFEQDGFANEKALREGREQKGAYIGEWKYDRLAGWLIKREG